MQNLLEETIRDLQDEGKTPKDVVWVGNRDTYAITWDEFAAIADFEYDDGFGDSVICDDLIVVGFDFWLERHKYDGSEWWEFKTMPQMPESPEKFNNVRTKYWSKLLCLVND